MESINLAVLSGIIKEEPTYTTETGRQVANFTVITYYSVGKGENKELHPEFHQVKLTSPGTIAKHLRRGKAVNILGRVVPTGGIIANSVNFPESRRNE